MPLGSAWAFSLLLPRCWGPLVGLIFVWCTSLEVCFLLLGHRLVWLLAFMALCWCGLFALGHSTRVDFRFRRGDCRKGAWGLARRPKQRQSTLPEARKTNIHPSRRPEQQTSTPPEGPPCSRLYPKLAQSLSFTINRPFSVNEYDVIYSFTLKGHVTVWNSV